MSEAPAKLSWNGKEIELPVVRGTENEYAIDISKLRAQTGAKGIVDIRRIDAAHGEMAIVHRQLFLQFNVMAQLHLAFGSPVATVKSQDEGKLADQIR